MALEPLQIGLREKTIILQGADRLSAAGFTQLPNHLLTDQRLSAGAKIAYAMLLRYAWRNSFCFPGQQTLARDMGMKERMVRNHLGELKAFDYLTVKQRGQGKTNIYILNLRVRSGKRAA